MTITFVQRNDYIREFTISNTRMSVAPNAWSSSILFETSFLRTRLDTAFDWPSSSGVIVGDRFPGVIWTACERSSLATLYMTMQYFVAVMYPSIRRLMRSTNS